MPSCSRDGASRTRWASFSSGTTSCSKTTRAAAMPNSATTRTIRGIGLRGTTSVTLQQSVSHPCPRTCGRLVEHLIDDGVRSGVVLAANVADIDGAKRAQKRLGLREEGDEIRVLHAEDARELAHDEFAIEPRVEFADAEIARLRETREQRAPFGAVVRRDAEVLADLRERRAVLGEQHRTASSGAGIAARTSIRKERRLHPRRLRSPPSGTRRNKRALLLLGLIAAGRVR